jgi:hypothetical protein
MGWGFGFVVFFFLKKKKINKIKNISLIQYIKKKKKKKKAYNFVFRFQMHGFMSWGSQSLF